MKSVTHSPKRRNIKSVCAFVVLSIIVVGNWYIYEGRQVYLPPSQRCSDKYPGYSVVLDLYVMMADGGYQNSDGTVYPPWATWESDGVIRGCPCTIKACVQRCCPESQKLERIETKEHFNISETSTDNNNSMIEMDYSMEYADDVWQNSTGYYTDGRNETTTNTVEYYDNFEEQAYTCTHADDHDSIVFWFKRFSTNNISDTGVISEKVFLSFGPVCDSMSEQDSSTLRTFDDGSIWDKNANEYIDLSEVCFHPLNGSIIQVYSCSHYPPFRKTAEDTDRFIKTTWQNSFMYVAMIIHVMTLVVFGLVPHLRTGYGKPVMCYVFSQLLRKIGIFLSKNIEPIQNIGPIDLEVESIFLGMEYFGDLASQCWQVAIAHKMWKAFSFKPGRMPNIDNRTSIIFFILPWIIPFVCMLLSGMWMEGYDVFWIADLGYHMRQIGAFIPGMTAEATCMILCMWTAYRMRAWQKGANKLRGPDSRRHNAKDVHWSKILLKVTMITGADYILVTSILMTRQGYFWPHTKFTIPPYLFTIPEDINNLRGVEIFFIFVLKSDVWKSLQNRFRSTVSSANTSRALTKRTRSS